MGFFFISQPVNRQKVPILPSDRMDGIHHGAAVLENHRHVRAAKASVHFRCLLLRILSIENNLSFSNMPSAGKNMLDGTDNRSFP